MQQIPYTAEPPSSPAWMTPEDVKAFQDEIKNTLHFTTRFTDAEWDEYNHQCNEIQK